METAMAYLSRAKATNDTLCRTRKYHMQALRWHMLNHGEAAWVPNRAFCWYWHPCHRDDIEDLLKMTGSKQFPYVPMLAASEL